MEFTGHKRSFNEVVIRPKFDTGKTNLLEILNAAGTSRYSLTKAGNMTVGGTTTLTGNATASGTLTVTGGTTLTGVTTPTGGIAPVSSVLGARTFWGGGIGPTLATMGNDTACDDGSRWVPSVFIPHNTTLTGIAYLIGSVGGTDDVIVELKDSTGASVANSILDASIIVGTAANVQSVAFTSTYAAIGPASFFLVVQFNGTTAK